MIRSDDYGPILAYVSTSLDVPMAFNWIGATIGLGDLHRRPSSRCLKGQLARDMECKASVWWRGQRGLTAFGQRESSRLTLDDWYGQ